MEKSIFNFKIQYKDGSTIDLHEDQSLWVSSFRILSLAPDHITTNISGRHGSIYLGTNLKERRITSKISVEARDCIAFDLLRDELFKVFNPLEKFYIIRDLQPGKRMEVSVASDFDLDYVSLEDGEFQIDFVIHSVFLESIGTTQEPFTFDSELWGIGMNLPTDKDLIYTHKTPTFSIYNAGDIRIDPRKLPLEIRFTGASDKLTIKNMTTGDEWKYTGSTNNGDIIELIKVHAFKNGISILSDTNRKFISLEKGWNEFMLDGLEGSFEISFNFRFYYF